MAVTAQNHASLVMTASTMGRVPFAFEHETYSNSLWLDPSSLSRYADGTIESPLRYQERAPRKRPPKVQRFVVRPDGGVETLRQPDLDSGALSGELVVRQRTTHRWG